MKQPRECPATPADAPVAVGRGGHGPGAGVEVGGRPGRQVRRQRLMAHPAERGRHVRPVAARRLRARDQDEGATPPPVTTPSPTLTRRVTSTRSSMRRSWVTSSSVPS